MANNNPFQYLNEMIFFYLLKEKLPHNMKVIKKNSESLNIAGDFSFPINSKIWSHFIKKEIHDGEIIVDNIFYYKKYSTDCDKAEISANLIEESKEWHYPIQNVNILEEKCICFLKRKQIIQNLLQQVLENENIFKENKSSSKLIHLKNNKNVIEDSISCYRANLIKNVLQNLLAFTEWTVVEDDSKDLENVLKVEIFSAGEKGRKLEYNSNICIQCGIVCDCKTKKIVKLTYSEYFSLRSRDMQLIAMHKYGVRIHNEKNLNELINKLGKAAVIVDFLEVTYTSPVSIITTGVGSSKGASFILYNYARCETILRTFYDKQKSNYYPELPCLEDIDKSVLEEDEEWTLLFNFILYFPEVIRRSVDGIENGRCSPHLICQFLSNFAAAFSIYYRKIKILTENREHLLPMLYARIYLVQCIKNIFLKNFKILGIEPVSYM